MKNNLNIKSPYIIAEIGSNFDQNIYLAKKLIKTAKNCGANAVKFQLFDSKKLYPKNKQMRDLFKKIELKKSWIKSLYDFSKKNNIEFFLSVFDTKTLIFLEKFNFNFYKIASSELTNINLLKAISNTKKTAILSTGMCDLDDVTKAVSKFKKKIILMQCHSVYPLAINQANLNVLKIYKKKFKNIILGFSDHTQSNIPAIVSVGMGALVFEKHITLNKKSRGPDHFYAYNPTQFKKYVADIHKAYQSLGLNKKILHPDEKKFGRRYGVYLVNDQKKNTIIKRKMLTIKQPALGIRDKYINKIIGKKLILDLKANEPILEHYIKS